MAERSFAKEVQKLRQGAGETFTGEGILGITKALLENGVGYVGGYQGSPISHLMDVLADAQDILGELGVHFEASASEASAGEASSPAGAAAVCTRPAGRAALTAASGGRTTPLCPAWLSSTSSPRSMVRTGAPDASPELPSSPFVACTNTAGARAPPPLLSRRSIAASICRMAAHSASHRAMEGSTARLCR